MSLSVCVCWSFSGGIGRCFCWSNGIDALKNVGGILGSSVSKNTFAVIAKSKEEDTGKASDAKKLGVPIMTPDEFLATYFS